MTNDILHFRKFTNEFVVVGAQAFRFLFSQHLVLIKFVRFFDVALMGQTHIRIMVPLHAFNLGFKTSVLSNLFIALTSRVLDFLFQRGDNVVLGFELDHRRVGL